jgi:phosphoribosyl 1,2-cyclic phosphodiesterase
MPAFTITYWGMTGALAVPLAPRQVTDKIERAIATLVEQGRLKDMAPGAALRDAVRREVERLPFHLRSTYGGNTTCVEVRTADSLIVLDCGSGFREWGLALARAWNAPGYTGPREAHILLTHSHIDHTHAVPFTDPCFDPRNRFILWAPRTVLESIRAVLDPASPLSRTYFPTTMGVLKGVRELREVHPGESFRIGATEITSLSLRHPGGCVGYRMEHAGRAFVFATDHEQIESPDPEVTAFAAHADLLYLDGQYLECEYDGSCCVPGEVASRPRRGWGHSTVEGCVATALAARVRELHIGHREPKRSDDDMAQFESYLQECVSDALQRAGFPADACTARLPFEGLTVTIG